MTSSNARHVPRPQRVVLYGLDGSVRTTEITDRVPATYAVGDTIAGVHEGDWRIVEVRELDDRSSVLICEQVRS
jgi:hypothetical protein